MTPELPTRVLDGARLFDLAPLALSVLDLNGRQVTANLAYRRLFALGDGTLEDVDALAISHPDERDRTATYLRELVAGDREEVRLQKRYVRRDGSEFTGELIATRLLDEDGRPAALLGIIQDISEQAAQTIELDRAHRRLEALLANISDTVTLVDEDGAILYSTGLHVEILGYPPEFWEDRSIFDLAEGSEIDRLMGVRQQVLDEPGRQVSTDIQVRHADGSWQDIELTAVNLLHDPLVGGIVITSRNITPRKQIEAELARRRDEALEQSRLRSEFVARVSHELRNQLHALQGLTELLSDSDVPRSARELAASAHRQSEQLKSVVDELLEYSRIEAGRQEANPAPSWARQIMADATAIGTKLARRGVEVLGVASEDVPDVVILDAGRVRQVLANLVSNAAKFTNEGRISLEVDRCDLDGRSGLRWTVRDTGVGISASDLERIFQPFDQGSSGETAGGTGLGLSITERLVDLLGGRIQVESRTGAGSVFVVEVPFEETDDEPAADRPVTSPVRRGAHVLVVEDNPVNQMLVAEQLSRLGARATVVDDGLDALDFVAEGEPVDCILMDWQMPGLDGVETTRRLRASERQDGHVPILGMTASAQPSDRRTCLDAGMDDLLVKPVGLRDLGSALARWIGPEPAPAQERPCGPAADVAALDRLAEDLGSVGPVRSIVGTYLTELGRRRELIQGAVTDGDADLLHRTAHTLRSTSRTLGAVELDEISSRLEHGAFPPPDSLMDDFERSADGTRRALQDWLDLHPATPG